MDYLEISREATEAYERLTGFSGLGVFMEQRGLFVFRESQEQRCEE